MAQGLQGLIAMAASEAGVSPRPERTGEDHSGSAGGQVRLPNRNRPPGKTVLAAARQHFCLAFLLRYPEATVFHAVQDAISNQTYS
jgi:hypothetical protein